MLFQKEYTVTSHDTDSKNIIKPSELLRYLQDTANSQMYEQKPSYEDLVSQNKAFIIARITVNIKEQIHKYDKLTVRSWPCVSKGVTSPRCYEVIKNGISIVKASSTWALVDRKNDSLVSMSDFQSNYTYGEEIHCDNERFAIPKAEMKNVGQYTVTYSKIDLNEHMNNTNYPNMFFDFIPDIKNKSVVGFTINYKKEIILGDTIDIQISDPHPIDDKTTAYYFQAVKNGIITTQAMFTVI